MDIACKGTPQPKDFLVHIILLKQNRVITSIVQHTIKPVTSIYDIRFFNIFV